MLAHAPHLRQPAAEMPLLLYHQLGAQGGWEAGSNTR
jgi:hypothetical protein